MCILFRLGHCAVRGVCLRQRSKADMGTHATDSMHTHTYTYSRAHTHTHTHTHTQVCITHTHTHYTHIYVYIGVCNTHTHFTHTYIGMYNTHSYSLHTVHPLQVGALRSEACYRQADVEARKAEGQLEAEALQR